MWRRCRSWSKGKLGWGVKSERVKGGRPPRATTLFTGAEFRLRPHVTLTPNVVFTRYDRNDDGVRPRSDLHLRLTLFLDFE